MIAFVEGVVVEVREASVVVQAGALGYELFAPRSTLMRCAAGETVRLHTHLVVKEDLLALYAFHTPDLLTMFRHLITVGGVGPKLGMAILSAIPAQTIAGAILNEDPVLLTSAPGVGKRTAERIILELKNKLPEHLAAGSGATRAAAGALPQAGEDATQALLALGYRESQVKNIIAGLAHENPDDPAEALIRKALGKLR